MSSRHSFFSEIYRDAIYNIPVREQKARKIAAILDDYFSGQTRDLSVLDIGCSIGVISSVLGKTFLKVTGTDTDAAALEYAREHFSSPRVEFLLLDALESGLPDGAYDVILCTQIYEHVPDPERLISEIERILKPGGVCFFSAMNSLTLIEEHHHLPLLSALPKPLANLYLKMMQRGESYDENPLTFWKLKKLVSRFEIIDYTAKIIGSPVKYHATEMLRPGTLKQKLAMFVLKFCYWLFPNYVWLLRRKSENKTVRRICLTTSNFPRHSDDVYGSFLFYFAREMVRQGVEVHVIAPHSPGAKPYEILKGIRVHRFRYFFPEEWERLCYDSGIMDNLKKRFLAVLGLPFYFVFQFLNLRRIMKKYDIQVINSHWMIPQGLIASLYVRIFGGTHISTAHAGDIFLLHKIPPGRNMAQFIV
ncbi:MAG TPA: methyltransferase domain-containing protein, partial [bacterium]|nr:methyltransferase domain-containing protein [bacterium]